MPIHNGLQIQAFAPGHEISGNAIDLIDEVRHPHRVAPEVPAVCGQLLAVVSPIGFWRCPILFQFIDRWNDVQGRQRLLVRCNEAAAPIEDVVDRRDRRWECGDVDLPALRDPDVWGLTLRLPARAPARASGASESSRRSRLFTSPRGLSECKDWRDVMEAGDSLQLQFR